MKKADRKYDIEIIITDSKSKEVIWHEQYEKMSEVRESFECQSINDKHIVTHLNIDIRK